MTHLQQKNSKIVSPLTKKSSSHLGVESEELSVRSLANRREPLVVFCLIVQLAGSLRTNLQDSFPESLGYCYVSPELQTLKTS